MKAGVISEPKCDWNARPRVLETPVGQGATLIDPPLRCVASLLAENRRRLAVPAQVHGRAIVELRESARRELRAAATPATREYADVLPPADDGPLFVAGHQPGLFHPGVWFKNVVLNRMAADHGGAAINLQIDGDTVKSTAIRVPTGTLDEPLALPVDFDAAGPELPWEERAILDDGVFESFGRRAKNAVAAFVPEPLVRTYWPRATARRRATNNLGACLAQARHQWELDLGLKTWELPHSSVSRFEAHRWLLADLLVRAPQFRDVHNQVLGEYRARFGVRSANHPVSALAVDGDWTEAPLWVWTAEEPRRRRLFVRKAVGQLEFTDRGRIRMSLPLGSNNRLEPVVDGLATLAAQGIKIRTRALLTTLFARVLLADAFLHGIGGGKYDRLTDNLIEQFYGLEAPEFLVATATVHLPIDRPQAAPAQLRDIEARLRELDYHPEAAPASNSLAAAALAAEKRRWIDTPVERGSGRTRCHAIRRLNESLSEGAGEFRRELLRQREQIQRRLRGESVLNSREFAFCLYPEADLRHFLLELPFRRP